MGRVQQYFKGKVIWITGASSGIGEEMARQFWKLGAKLILSARNEQNLIKVKNSIDPGADSIKVLPLDLENIEEIEAKVSTSLALYGEIDYLVNNAGLAIRDFVEETEFSIDVKLLKINYLGPITLTKYLLPHYKKQGSGHFVTISSLSGKYGVPKLAAYSAPKHALHGFFESLRSELSNTNILITIIVPGIIQTNITANALTGSGDSFGKVEKAFQNAYPVQRAVKQMIKAIAKGKEEIFVGGSEGITLTINRISPWFLRRFIRNHPLKRLRSLKKALGLK